MCKVRLLAEDGIILPGVRRVQKETVLEKEEMPKHDTRPVSSRFREKRTVVTPSTRISGYWKPTTAKRRAHRSLKVKIRVTSGRLDIRTQGGSVVRVRPEYKIGALPSSPPTPEKAECVEAQVNDQ